MQCKKLLISLLLLIFFGTLLPPFGKASTINRIDSDFLVEVQDSNEWIRIIIEFNDLPSVEYYHHSTNHMRSTSHGSPKEDLHSFVKNYQLALEHKQQKIVASIQNQGVKMIPDQPSYWVLNGISAEIIGRDIPSLIKFPQIRYIHDDRMLFKPIRHMMSRSTRAMEAWEGLPDINIEPLSGNRKLIGVIDTGLEEHHREFSRSRKVRGGFNFADSVSDYRDFHGHGTHVAGIALGEGGSLDQQGMAYEAEIMVYRVFSPRFEGARNVIAAIDRAVSDRCDVINLSLGGHSDGPSRGNSAYHRSIRNADRAGSMVVAGAGNSASRRAEIPWPIISPSIIYEAFSVAGSNDRNERAVLTVYPGQSNEKKIMGTYAPPTGKLTTEMFSKGIVHAGYGRAQDFNDVSVRGKVTLIQRGPLDNPITFREKVENATRNGALGVVLYNHTPGEVMTPGLMTEHENPTQLAHLVPTIMLTLEDGTFLKNQIVHSPPILVKYESSATISTFSSMGPSGDATFKPEITAPATQINSTFPGNRYASLDGTSMATPCISGLVALIKEAKPQWTHDQIKSAFMNTADIMLNPATGLPIPFIMQGAGSVRIDKALSTPAFLEPRAKIFSEARSSFSQSIQVTSTRDVEETFELVAEVFHFAHETSPISISIEPEKFNLGPRGTATVEVQFEIDFSNFKQSKYDGIIKIGNDLHFPFVCYKNSSRDLEDPISNIRLSNNQLNLTLDADEQESTTYISFSLNTGHFFRQIHNRETILSGSNFATLYIKVIDSFGEPWGEFQPRHLMVGEYTIPWTGKNSQNRYFLPTGDFFIQIQMNQYENRGTAEWEVKPYASVKQAFHVTHSNVPDPFEAVFSSLRQYREREDVLINLQFDSFESLVTKDVSVESIEFQFHYLSERLMYRRFEKKGFLVDLKDEIQFQMDIDDYEGILKVHIDCNNIPLENLDYDVFMTFIFRTVRSGRALFSIRGFMLHLCDGNSIRVNSSLPLVRISNRPFLLSDINNDGVVDRADFEIFNNSYGSKKGEHRFDERCDFNQDGKIDHFDLNIIAQEMGKAI